MWTKYPKNKVFKGFTYISIVIVLLLTREVVLQYFEIKKYNFCRVPKIALWYKSANYVLHWQCLVGT